MEASKQIPGGKEKSLPRNGIRENRKTLLDKKSGLQAVTRLQPVPARLKSPVDFLFHVHQSVLKATHAQAWGSTQFPPSTQMTPERWVLNRFPSQVRGHGDFSADFGHCVASDKRLAYI